MHMRHRILIICAATTLLATQAIRADDRGYDLKQLGDRTPSKRELIEALTVKPSLPTRGGEPAPPLRARAISSSIGFLFNSSELTNQGKEFLNNLGAALSDEALRSAHLILEGHTDAVGSEGYNLDLSKRRADAVRDFLVSIWGVPSEHLKVVGKGKAELLDSEHPDDAANRAVAIINTGAN
jgi:OmpA-OmpF porin, OOP family